MKIGIIIILYRPSNKIESFYLQPLLEAFEKMRRNLFCLMLKGMNFYKAPLLDN